jgi:hypothetical protein
LAKCQEKCYGLDLKPLFVKYFQMKIERLEKAEELNILIKQGKTDLTNYKIAEQILATC